MKSIFIIFNHNSENNDDENLKFRLHYFQYTYHQCYVRGAPRRVFPASAVKSLFSCSTNNFYLYYYLRKSNPTCEDRFVNN